MPQPNFLGNEYLLEIIIGKQVEISSLESKFSSNISDVFYSYKWTRYFTMLKKTVYVNLVKEFWKHVYVDFLSEGVC